MFFIFLSGVSLLSFMLLFFFMSFLLKDISTFNFSKLSAFECGFQSLGLVQLSFSLHFFLMLLIFIIFDLELVFFLGFLFMDSTSFLIFFMFCFFIFFTFFLEYYFSKLVWVF